MSIEFNLIDALYRTDLHRLRRAFELEDPRGVSRDTFVWLLATLVPSLHDVISTFSERHESEWGSRRRHIHERAAQVEEHARLITESRWRQQQREREEQVQLVAAAERKKAAATMSKKPRKSVAAPENPLLPGEENAQHDQQQQQSRHQLARGRADAQDPKLLSYLQSAIPSPPKSSSMKGDSSASKKKTGAVDDTASQLVSTTAATTTTVITTNPFTTDPASLSFTAEQKEHGMRLRATLEGLFVAMDIDGDERTSWEELYTFAITTTMHRLTIKPSDVVRLYGVAKTLKRSDNVVCVSHFGPLRAIGIASRHESVELLDQTSLKVIARASSKLINFDNEALIKPSAVAGEDANTGLAAAIQASSASVSSALSASSMQSLAMFSAASGDSPTITHMVYVDEASVVVATADNLRLYVWSVNAGGDPAMIVRGKHIDATSYRLSPVCSVALKHGTTQMRTAPSAPRLAFLSNTAGQLLCYELFDVHAPRLRYCFALHAPGTPITDFCFMGEQEHKIITAAFDRTIRVTDVHLLSEGHTECFWVVGESEHVPQHVTYCSEHELIVTGSIDKSVRAWTAHATRRPAQLFFDSANPHLGKLVGVLAVGGSQLISADAHGQVKVWDVRSFLAAQTLVVGAAQREVIDEAGALADSGSAKAAGSAAAQFFNKSAAAVSRDLALNGVTYLMGSDSFCCVGPGKIVLHKYDAGAMPNRATEESFVVSAQIAADQNGILMVTPQSLVMWDAATGSIAASVSATSDGKNIGSKSDDFSAMSCDLPDRRILAGTRAGVLMMWSTAGLNRIMESVLQPHSNSSRHSSTTGNNKNSRVSAVTGVAFCAPYNSVVSIGTDGVLQVQRLDSLSFSVSSSRFLLSNNFPLCALSVSDACATAACGDDEGNLFVCDVLSTEMPRALLFRTAHDNGAPSSITATTFCGAFPCVIAATSDGWLCMYACRPAPDGVLLAKWKIVAPSANAAATAMMMTAAARSQTLKQGEGGGMLARASMELETKLSSLHPSSSTFLPQLQSRPPTSAHVSRSVRHSLASVNQGNHCDKKKHDVVAELLDARRSSIDDTDAVSATCLHFDPATDTLFAGTNQGDVIAWSLCPILSRYRSYGLKTTSFVSMGEFLNYKWSAPTRSAFPSDHDDDGTSADHHVPTVVAYRAAVHQSIVSIDTSALADVDDDHERTLVVTAGESDQRVCVMTLSRRKTTSSATAAGVFSVVGDLAYGRPSNHSNNSNSSSGANKASASSATRIGEDQIAPYNWPKSRKSSSRNSNDAEDDPPKIACVRSHELASFYAPSRVCEHGSAFCGENNDQQQQSVAQMQRLERIVNPAELDDERSAALGDVLAGSAEKSGSVSAYRILNPPDNVIATGKCHTQPLIVGDQKWQHEIEERNKVVASILTSASTANATSTEEHQQRHQHQPAEKQLDPFAMPMAETMASSSKFQPQRPVSGSVLRSRVSVSSARVGSASTARRFNNLDQLPRQDGRNYSARDHRFGAAPGGAGGQLTDYQHQQQAGHDSRHFRLSNEEIAAMARRGAEVLEEQARKLREHEDELERAQAARNVAEAEVASIAASAPSTRDTAEREDEVRDMAPSLPGDLAPSQLLLAASHEQRRMAAIQRLPSLFVGPQSSEFKRAAADAAGSAMFGSSSGSVLATSRRFSVTTPSFGARPGSAVFGASTAASFTYQPSPTLLDGVVCGDGMMCSAAQRPRQGSQLRSIERQQQAQRAAAASFSSSATAMAIQTARTGLRIGTNSRPGSSSSVVGARSSISLLHQRHQSTHCAQKPGAPSSSILSVSAPFRGVPGVATPSSIPSPREPLQYDRVQLQRCNVTARQTLSEKREQSLASYNKELHRALRWPGGKAGGIPMDRNELMRQAMLDYNLNLDAQRK